MFNLCYRDVSETFQSRATISPSSKWKHFAHPDGQHRQANALPEHLRLLKPDSNGVNTWIQSSIYEKRLLKIQFLPVSQVSVGIIQLKGRKSGHLVENMDETWKRIQVHEKCTQKPTVIFCWSTNHMSFPTEQPQVMFANFSPGLLSDLVTLLLPRCADPYDPICTFRWNAYFRKLVLASTSNCSSRKAKNCWEFEASTGYRDPVSTIKEYSRNVQLSLMQLNCTWSTFFKIYIYISDT